MEYWGIFGFGLWKKNYFCKDKKDFQEGKKVKLFLLLLILSSVTLVTAISEERCDYIYFWIAQNNYAYTNISLINANITEDQIFNYPFLCGKELPQPNLPKLVVYENQPEECNYQEGFLKEYIPFFEVEKGQMNCSQLKTQSFFFQLEEKQNGEYSARGINAFIFIFVTFLLVLSGIKLFSKMNEDEDRNI